MGKPSVTVHIAEAGTPLKGGGKSTPGHMWYELHDGKGGTPQSYGFAPVNSVPVGRGNVVTTDTKTYLDRIGMRTFEISQSQFDIMQDFGRNSQNYGFNKKLYIGTTNSCTDFTWKALEVGGFEIPTQLIGTYNGAFLPIDNVKPLRKLPGKEISYPGEKDYMKGKPKDWYLELFGLGGSQQANLMAMSTAPSFNYTSHKKDAVAAYTLMRMLDNTINTVPSVTFNGKTAYVLAQTTQPDCYGDEAGIGGGVKSSTVGKEVKPTSGSTSILVAGKLLVREGDSCTMNNENTVGKYILA